MIRCGCRLTVCGRAPDGNHFDGLGNHSRVENRWKALQDELLAFPAGWPSVEHVREARSQVHSIATLSKIEAQVRCVTDKELIVIARALKVSVADLFKPLGQRTIE